MATAAAPAPPSPAPKGAARHRPAPPSPAPKGAPMSEYRKFLHDLLCPHHIDRVTGDEQARDAQAKDKYDDFQNFLSTVMTIGTLLLGFILTGTLLNYNYQGNRSRAEFAFPFDIVSGAAAAFAAVSVMLSLWASVRASVIFRNNGPRKALRAMRNSTLGIGVAELSLYVSVNFFFISVMMYVFWAQQGPSEMCGKKSTVKHCPMMERDLRKEFDRLCDDNATIGTQVLKDVQLCHYREWKCEPVTPQQDGVNMSEVSEWPVCGSYKNHPTKVPLFHNMTRVASLVHWLASELCRTKQLEDIAEKLCEAGNVSDDLKGMRACASANTDALAAAECTDDMVDLAKTCNNVCDSSADFEKKLKRLTWPGTSVLVLVMIVRAIKIGQQVWATWQYNVTTSKQPWLYCCHEAGILDALSSEEEEQQRDLKVDAHEQPVPSVNEGMSTAEEAKGASPRAPAVLGGLGWFFCGGSKRPVRTDSQAALCEDGQGTR